MDQIRLYNILRKDIHLTDEQAADFILAMGITMGSEIEAKMQLLATKEDMRSLHSKIEQTKLDMHKAIYTSGIVQFIAIIGSILALMKFLR